MKIAIVEDDQRLLNTYDTLFSGEPEVEVIDTSTSGEEALEKLEYSQPNVMLVDIGLPGMSGIELTSHVKGQFPEVEIIVHTVFGDRESVFSAIKAGATGYIQKGATPRELVNAIQVLYSGGAPMSPQIARMVIGEFQNAHNDDAFILTPREKEIVKMMESGLTYKEIGAKLFISPNTVHSHIKKIYEKLHAKNRRDLFTKARKKGVI